MNINERDLEVLRFVARFGQLTSKHIQSLVFKSQLSPTPLDRTLERLVERRMLARLEHRIVGGAKGGSGVYVYQVGTEGWRIFFEGRPRLSSAVDYHGLAVADLFVALAKLEEQGKLKVGRYLVEAEAYVKVAGQDLRPDMYAELSQPDGSGLIRFMFEMDMGTQTSQIGPKFTRYWRAYEGADDDEWPEAQLVMFLAVNDHRADELRYMLDRFGRQVDGDWRSVFRVRTVPGLIAELS